MTGTTAPAGVSCPTCGEYVPAGVFCGACGSNLQQATQGARAGFRSRVYAPAPGERVLRLAVVSSLFPHLPSRSRAPFRVAVLLVLAVLITLAALRLQAPLVATSAVGLPLLFVLYMQQGRVYEGLPLLPLAGAGVLGAGFGYGWATLTGGPLSRAISEALLRGVTAHLALVYGVLLPLGAAALTVAPGILMRLLRPREGSESLDGYLVGAVGAAGFACVSTLTLLAPQLRTGVAADGRPLRSLIVEALLQGVAVPLTAVGVGGVVGAAVWLQRGGRVHSGRWLSSPVTAVAAAAVLYVAAGLVDVWQFSDLLGVTLHLIFAAAALLALRFGTQAVLLHEKHDFQVGGPAVCAHCEQVVAQMPFCPLCGAASHVSSRHHRRVLQLSMPPADSSPVLGPPSDAAP